MRKWVMWIPVLMVGALLYWTIALSFGGLSLLTFTALHDPDILDSDGATSYQNKDSYQSITVNLADMRDQEGDVADHRPEWPQDPDSVTVDLLSDHESGPGGEHGQSPRGAESQDRGNRDRGPGKTAF